MDLKDHAIIAPNDEGVSQVALPGVRIVELSADHLSLKIAPVQPAQVLNKTRERGILAIRNRCQYRGMRMNLIRKVSGPAGSGMAPLPISLTLRPACGLPRRLRCSNE